MKAALKMVSEWRLVVWARNLNEQHALAPSTEAVLQRYEDLRERMPDAVRVPYRGTVAEASARMWATKFRRRWKGRFGGMRVREEVPVAELKTKAGSKMGPRESHSEHFFGGFGACFWFPVWVFFSVPNSTRESFYTSNTGDTVETSTVLPVGQTPENREQSYIGICL